MGSASPWMLIEMQTPKPVHPKWTLPDSTFGVGSLYHSYMPQTLRTMMSVEQEIWKLTRDTYTGLYPITKSKFCGLHVWK